MQFILPSILTRKFKNRKRINTNIAFTCAGCDVEIIKNSREHDECWTKNDKDWFCGDCACEWGMDTSDSSFHGADVCECDNCEKPLYEGDLNIVGGNYYCDDCLTPELAEQM